MTHTWQRIGLSTVLAAALLGTSAVAADPAVDSTVAELQKQLGNLKEALNRLEKIEDRLRETQIKNDLTATNLQKEVNQLKKQMDDIQRSVADLNSQMAQLKSGTATVAKRIDSGSGNGLLGMGRVRLMNSYPAPMSFWVNGATYYLMPGEERTVTVPVGTFRYQILGLQSATQSRPIRPDETFTLRIHPEGT